NGSAAAAAPEEGPVPTSRTKAAAPRRAAKRKAARKPARSTATRKAASSPRATQLDWIERAHQYAQRVVGGQVIACREVRLACGRHLRDLERQGTPDFPYVFDAGRAEEFCAFAELL